MSVSRWWTETVAALGDHVPLSLVALLLVAAALVAGLAWYTFPAWVPRRLPRLRLTRRRPFRWRPLRLRWPRLRLRLPRLRRRRRSDDGAPAADPTPAPDAPDLPVAPLAGPLTLADRLAAEGRYAEAIRERLRDMVGELVVRQVVPPQPGLTVLEVGATVARNRPPAGPAMEAAGAIFSEVWYAQRPASAEQDRRMRDLAGELHRVLTAPPAVVPPAALPPAALPAPAGPGDRPAAVPEERA
ncbi:DUF4129 domain-containing protein [Micromonospora costi]|uniref:DUF4129 domain-containing protein n=1 Tax=Micromonospora costi TaxID=1530042 RepID=UPI001F4E21FB|nr:DUF4129 domain-containing protein [Micromonospora costi]